MNFFTKLFKKDNTNVDVNTLIKERDSSLALNKKLLDIINEDGKSTIILQTEFSKQHETILALQAELNALNGRDRNFNAEQKNVIHSRVNGVCEDCGIDTVPFKGQPNSFEADHIVPFSKGGFTSIDNGQCLCRTCNRSKGGK